MLLFTRYATTAERMRQKSTLNVSEKLLRLFKCRFDSIQCFFTRSFCRIRIAKPVVSCNVGIGQRLKDVLAAQIAQFLLVCVFFLLKNITLLPSEPLYSVMVYGNVIIIVTVSIITQKFHIVTR